jgi:hypothetical protein
LKNVLSCTHAKGNKVIRAADPQLLLTNPAFQKSNFCIIPASTYCTVYICAAFLLQNILNKRSMQKLGDDLVFAMLVVFWQYCEYKRLAKLYCILGIAC